MQGILTIRAAGPDNIGAVDALLARSYPALLKADYPPSVMVTAVPIIARANPALVTCGSYYVVEDAQGAVLGAGGWTRARRGRARADVRHVATDPACVRQGIGRALLSHVLAEAAGAGVGALDCLSTRSAVPFYRAMGFATVGRVEVPLAPGIVFPAVRMVRGA